jgi:chromate transporter
MNTLLNVIYSFIKIGLVSLGGGNSMLKLLEYEAVNYRHWVSPEEFVAMVGTSFIFPGLTAVKLSALIGYKAAGIMGLILAVLCLNVPGLIMAAAGYHWLTTHNGPVTRKIMIAVQYGALALLAAATFSIAQSVVSINYSLPIAIACVFFFLALAFWNLSPFYGFIGFITVCFFLIR